MNRVKNLYFHTWQIHMQFTLRRNVVVFVDVCPKNFPQVFRHCYAFRFSIILGTFIILRQFVLCVLKYPIKLYRKVFIHGKQEFKNKPPDRVRSHQFLENYKYPYIIGLEDIFIYVMLSIVFIKINVSKWIIRHDRNKILSTIITSTRSQFSCV